ACAELGSQIVGRPGENLAARLAGPGRDAKIEKCQVPRGGDEDVRWLDVAMDAAESVEELEDTRELKKEVTKIVPLVDGRAQVDAVDVVHREERVFCVDDELAQLDQGGMCEVAQHAKLALERG